MLVDLGMYTNMAGAIITKREVKHRIEKCHYFHYVNALLTLSILNLTH